MASADESLNQTDVGFQNGHFLSHTERNMSGKLSSVIHIVQGIVLVVFGVQLFSSSRDGEKVGRPAQEIVLSEGEHEVRITPNGIYISDGKRSLILSPLEIEISAPGGDKHWRKSRIIATAFYCGESKQGVTRETFLELEGLKSTLDAPHGGGTIFSLSGPGRQLLIKDARGETHRFP